MRLSINLSLWALYWRLRNGQMNGKQKVLCYAVCLLKRKWELKKGPDPNTRRAGIVVVLGMYYCHQRIELKMGHHKDGSSLEPWGQDGYKDDNVTKMEATYSTQAVRNTYVVECLARPACP
jgi:hypothetical protein